MSIKNAVITVTSATYATDPDFDAGFRGQVSLALMSLPANGELYASFDGVTDHVKLAVGAVSGWGPSLSNYQKVWLRKGTPNIDVQVQIESPNH